MVKVLIILLILSVLLLVFFEVKNLLNKRKIKQKKEEEHYYTSFPSRLISMCKEEIEIIYQDKKYDDDLKKIICLKNIKEDCINSGLTFGNEQIKAALNATLLQYKNKIRKFKVL